MDVPQIRCYNKEKNEFREFNEHCVDARFSKITGYYPVKEPKEKPILENVSPDAQPEQTTSPLNIPVHKKRGRKPKINAN